VPEIKIYGQLDNSWLARFEDTKTPMGIATDYSQVTTLTNLVMD